MRCIKKERGPQPARHPLPTEAHTYQEASATSFSKPAALLLAATLALRLLGGLGTLLHLQQSHRHRPVVHLLVLPRHLWCPLSMTRIPRHVAQGSPCALLRARRCPHTVLQIPILLLPNFTARGMCIKTGGRGVNTRPQGRPGRSRFVQQKALTSMRVSLVTPQKRRSIRMAIP